MSESSQYDLPGKDTETYANEAAEKSSVGQTNTKLGGIDKNLAVVRFSVHPQYIELIVEGTGFPQQFWCRLGNWTGSLRRRSGAPELERLGQKLYTAIPDSTLDDADLSVTMFDGETPSSFELRRGDRKGRHPKGWADSIVCRPEGAIVASEPEFSGLDLKGWAIDGAAPDNHIRVRLVEHRADDGGGMQDVLLANTVADQPSAQGQNWHGIKNSGYQVSLPEAVFDGSLHQLVLEAWCEQDCVTLWKQGFVATDDIMWQRLSQCQDSGELYNTLVLLARTGRLGMLSSYFDAPQSFSSVSLTRRDAFSLLGQGVLLGASVNRDDDQEVAIAKLEQRFRAACLEIDEGQLLVDSVNLVDSALKSRANDVSLGRYPHAPLAEAACDLAVVATKGAFDRNTVLTLASLCISSGRYLLARDLLQPMVERDSKFALPPTLLASAEISLGNLDSAEALLRKALGRNPKFPKALNQVARLYAKRGQHLDAAAVLSGGMGLTRWVHEPPSYQHSKYFAALDWHDLNKQIALAEDNRAYLEHLMRADAIFGPPPNPRAEGFSVIFLDKAKRDRGAIFKELSPLGCVQVANQHGATMDNIEGIGTWSLLYLHVWPNRFGPQIIGKLFSQMRRFEPVAELLGTKVNEKGLPEKFVTTGLIVRNDTLRLFGACTPEEFAIHARACLSTKALLT